MSMEKLLSPQNTTFRITQLGLLAEGSKQLWEQQTPKISSMLWLDNQTLYRERDHKSDRKSTSVASQNPWVLFSSSQVTKSQHTSWEHYFWKDYNSSGLAGQDMLRMVEVVAAGDSSFMGPMRVGFWHHVFSIELLQHLDENPEQMHCLATTGLSSRKSNFSKLCTSGSKQGPICCIPETSRTSASQSILALICNLVYNSFEDSIFLRAAESWQPIV